MRPFAAVNSSPDREERWPSSAAASTLLLSLEARARWREHVALATDDDRPEPEAHGELVDPEAVSP